MLFFIVSNVIVWEPETFQESCFMHVHLNLSCGLLSLAFLVVAAVLWSEGAVGMNADVEWRASWIWKHQDSYTRYNDTIEALKEVELPRVASATLRITADTRYRLYINEQWVNDGPSRSWPRHYQYDVVDVGGYLRPGVNSIRIIAKFFGIGTFHQIPQEAGLLAQLEFTGKDGESIILGTDESWQVRTVPAWLANTPKQSVQMGPFEIYDAREPETAFENAQVRYAAEAGPWKALEPRDCALLTRIPFLFKAVTAANVVKKPNATTFVFPTSNWLYDDIVYSNHHVVTTGAYATLLEMGEQGGEVVVDADGQTAYVEGQRVEGNRFKLPAGRHLLFTVLTEYWGHWRNDTEIRLVSDNAVTFVNPLDETADGPWCFIPFSPEVLYRIADYEWALMPKEKQVEIERHIRRTIEEQMKDAPTAATFAASFRGKARMIGPRESTESPYYLFTHREVVQGASAPVERPETLLSGDRPVVVSPVAQGDVELIFDLGEQNIGYYEFELDAEAGLVVDLFGVEYIDPDGRVQFTDRYRNGMRYICREGENRFLSLMRRSQRYLFVTLRNQTRPVTLKRLSLVESTYPVNRQGEFACSDESLTRIWDISARTLKLCMEDVFTDCPLYEQTLWVGDSRNEALFNYTAFGHADIAQRCIRLAALSLDKYPLVQCQVPSTWETIIPVWGFLWNFMSWDVYEYTGDKAFLEWVYPYAVKNLRNAESFSDERGLFSAPFWNMFDWSGIDDGHRTVVHNNMFAVGAVDAVIKIADVLKKGEDREWLLAYRDRLSGALNRLWREDTGVYPDSVYDTGEVSTRVSIHNVFLPLLFDIAPEDKKSVLVEHLLNPPEGMTPIGSPFAILYLFLAMDKVGLHDQLIERIQQAYQPMLDLGATTVWETFAQGQGGTDGFPTRSHTHAWSSAPLYFLNRIVLGIRPEAPGGAAFAISPRLCGLTWAKGASASINGPVSVSWTRDGDTLSISAEAPAGAQLRFEKNDSMDGLTVLFNGQAVP